MDHYHVRLFAFDLTGKEAQPQDTLFIFGWMGVQKSNQDGVMGRYYIQSAITGEYLQGIADIFDDLITDFMSQDGVPTAVNSMGDMLALNNLLFVKTLLTAKKNPKNRISYFKQNIDKNYIEVFNGEVAPKLPDAERDLWDWWYDEYMINKNPIDQVGVVIFLSIMLDEEIDVIDDWFRNTDDFNFEWIDIELQPWFKPEFLVLHKYFPNVQHVN